MAEDVFDLRTHPVHLGLGATARVQETFTGDMAWYMRYGQRNAKDGVEGRLVSVHTFAEPWDSWEVHPKGDELVVCLSGRITLYQQTSGGVRAAVLEPGQAIVNAAGVWHTADVDDEATALFVTAGEGTEHRPRRPGETADPEA